jgi:hypothetical protein
MPAVGVAILLSAQVWLSSRLSETDVSWVEMPWSQLEKWNPILYRTMSFGHLPAAVDWLWMRSLQDPSYSHVPAGVHPPAFYDLDLATDLDPAYYEAYVDGALHLVVVRDDDRGAETLLLKANEFRTKEMSQYGAEFVSQFWSEHWQVPIILGYVYLLEITDLPKAAEMFLEAGKHDNVPIYVKSIAERLKKPGGIYEVAYRVVNTLIVGTKDDRLKEQFAKKRDSIKVLSFLDTVERSFYAALKSEPASLPKERVQKSWKNFLAINPHIAVDPFGGRLSLGDDGRVTTTTKYDKVFNLR